MRNFYLTATACCLLLATTTFAQEKKDWGHLSGSFESYTQYYQKDSAINAIVPQDRIGSNNYLKLDYNYKQFSAGIQFESYLPTIAGFPFTLNESKLINRYFKYSGKRFSVQVGGFYEQFGSGLVFRSWENRQIGINNALEGANVQVGLADGINLKAIWGRQRKIFDHANSNVRGADLEFDFSEMAKNPGTTRVAAGLSIVSRYQEYTGPNPDLKPTVNAGSFRLDVSGAVASASLEYVVKGVDIQLANNFDITNGKALLFNGTFSKNKLGVNLTFRAMENMDFRGERTATGVVVPVNYIPALTKQHDFLVTNIYVYNPQPMGETGGQVDVFYDLSNDPSKPSNLAINFSHYGSLDDMNNIFSFGDVTYFQDFNVEWKKKWNQRWTTTAGYYNIHYNKSVIEGGLHDTVNAHIVVFSGLYKFAKLKSVRVELQHLYTKEDFGNWAAAVAELSFAPKWTFFVSDLYNYGETDIHYPNVGGSYTRGGTRFGLSYGRQRAGLFCVGGVCRFVPAATGITATLTTTLSN